MAARRLSRTGQMNNLAGQISGVKTYVAFVVFDVVCVGAWCCGCVALCLFCLTCVLFQIIKQHMSKWNKFKFVRKQRSVQNSNWGAELSRIVVGRFFIQRIKWAETYIKRIPPQHAVENSWFLLYLWHRTLAMFVAVFSYNKSNEQKIHQTYSPTTPRC